MLIVLVSNSSTRLRHSAGDVYFFEDFSERIDALRHHDQRRAIMRRGEEQPGAVRSFYLDPDAAAPDESDGRRDPSSVDLPEEAAADLDAPGGALVPSDVPLGELLFPRMLLLGELLAVLILNAHLMTRFL